MDASIGTNLIAADSAFQVGDLAATEAHCHLVLQAEPQNSFAMHLLALVRRASGEAVEAERLLEHVVALNPTSLDALLHLADLLRDRGQVERAVAFTQQALRSDPTSPDAYHSLGLCCLSQQRLPQAAGCFQRASKLNPSNALYPLHLGIVHHSMGNFSSATAFYRHSIELDPSLSEPYTRLGLLLMGEGKRSLAISSLRKAVDVDPKNSRAHTLLGAALKEEGLVNEANRHLEQAATTPQGEVALGLGLQEMGRFDEARVVFERAIASNPYQGAAYHALTRGRRITEGDRSFVDQMQLVIEQGGLSPEDEGLLHFAVGKALEDLKEYQGALQHFDQANSFLANYLRLEFDPQKHSDYFDRLIDTFSKASFARNRALGSGSELPLFIVGMIRSGTTLVEQILSSHPQIGAAGEIRFWLEREGSLLKSLNANSLDFPSASQITLEYRNLLRALAPRHRRVTDKMPLNFMLLGIIHTLFPKAKIIHCRRNPVDNCLSIYSTHFVVSPNYAHKRENLVFFHQQYQRLMEYWRRVLPQEVLLEVDYEELVADRKSVTRRMIAHAGLDWDDACLHHEQNQRSVTTPSAWQVRQPIYSSSVERWRKFEPWLGSFGDLLPRPNL